MANRSLIRDRIATERALIAGNVAVMRNDLKGIRRHFRAASVRAYTVVLRTGGSPDSNLAKEYKQIAEEASLRATFPTRASEPMQFKFLKFGTYQRGPAYPREVVEAYHNRKTAETAKI